MELDELLQKALSGDTLAIARSISTVERRRPEARELLKRIYPHTGKAYYIGVTGPPGAGKSTLVDRLTRKFCEDGFSVGIVAVDPSSPYSGGAILGDRIRMSTKKKPGWDVFFRSMSAGNVVGGLAAATKEAARILDACGKQIIIVETVGVGQSELDVAGATDTVLVVLVPESGDSVQMMKAGLMEIADVFAVNKSDRSGAEAIGEAITNMLGRRSTFHKYEWLPPVYMTAAMRNWGIDELHQGILKHRAFLMEDSRLAKRRKSQLKAELHRLVEKEVSRIVGSYLEERKEMDRMLDEVWDHKTDPESVAWDISEKIGRRIKG